MSSILRLSGALILTLLLASPSFGWGEGHLTIIIKNKCDHSISAKVHAQNMTRTATIKPGKKHTYETTTNYDTGYHNKIRIRGNGKILMNMSFNTISFGIMNGVVEKKTKLSIDDNPGSCTVTGTTKTGASVFDWGLLKSTGTYTLEISDCEF